MSTPPKGDTLLIWDMMDYVEDLDLWVLAYLRAHHPKEFKKKKPDAIPDHLLPLLGDMDVRASILQMMLRVMWVGQEVKHRGGSMLGQLGAMVELCMQRIKDTEPAHTWAVRTAEVCEKMLGIVPNNVTGIKYLAFRDNTLYAIGTYHEN